MFEDRVEAGRQLATQLERFRGSDAVILGLPRGGVPVAAEVAKTLGLPLDVIMVRKIGVPFQPEVAMGAIGEGGVRIMDQDILARVRPTEAELRSIEAAEQSVLQARTARLRRGRERISLAGRTAIIVDDGVATGATARVACEVARRLGAAKVVLAVPVGAADTLEQFTTADEIVSVLRPAPLLAVGYHYRDFSPTSEEEVITLLDSAARRMSRGRAPGIDADADIEVRIPVGTMEIAGHLHLPEPASGVVVFAHGSGSSRHSPRNRLVADVLYEAGLGTLLLDLLTPTEEVHKSNVFDIDLLARRLVAATRWLSARPDTSSTRIGYFGASTGAAAAMVAAAELGAGISAVVSRGGRPELAGAHLSEVTAPTLLIVGGSDPVVLDLNRRALNMLPGTKQLSIVEGATHLFEEPGALAEVAILARDWFSHHLLDERVAQ
jgi:putative phosphoribosyl transferase